MKPEELLVKRYQDRRRTGTLLVDMSAMEVAGYFLCNYKNTPIESLRTYKILGELSGVICMRAEQILLSLRRALIDS